MLDMVFTCLFFCCHCLVNSIVTLKGEYCILLDY